MLVKTTITSGGDGLLLDQDDAMSNDIRIGLVDGEECGGVDGDMVQQRMAVLVDQILPWENYGRLIVGHGSRGDDDEVMEMLVWSGDSSRRRTGMGTRDFGTVANKGGNKKMTSWSVGFVLGRSGCMLVDVRFVRVSFRKKD